MAVNALQKTRTLIDKSVTQEEIQQKKAEKTINNWLEIQKKVKEVQSLEEMMDEQHEDHNNKLEAKARELYTLKIKSRKIYNDIKYLKLTAEGNPPSERPLDNYIEEKNDTILVGAKESITKFLFIIRENFDYIPRIVSLIGENTKREKVESLAELFCNQFYDNILIPNPEQEELLICIFKLLELEINKMYSSNVEQFLNDSTFIGIFMTVFSKQHDLNIFIANLLNTIMHKVENKIEGCFDLSLYAIQRYFKREEKKRKDEEKELDKSKKEKKEKEEKKEEEKKETKEEKERKEKEKKEKDEKKIKKLREFFKIIPKTELHFNKSTELLFEVEEENKKNINNEEENEKPKNEIIEIKEEKKEEDKKKEENEEDLTFQKILEKIKTAKNEDIKALYNNILNQIVDDPNTFCKEKLEKLLCHDNYDKKFDDLIKVFRENILFIQEQVESLLQSLINRLTAIPYIVRCICKMIDILIAKKFPKLPKYLRHSYIGKFLFNKCIFPILSLENKASLKKTIFSQAQKRLLLTIVNIIETANQCQLYTHYNDIEKIYLNNYLLDIIPILNKFYDKLVDLRLPRQLNEYISHAFEDIEPNTFSFGGKNIKNEKKKKKFTTYNYFSQNPDEILRLQSICFTVDDAIFLKDLIDFNEDKFTDLPKFYNLKKAIEDISSHEYQIDDAKKKYGKEGKSFFLIHQIDKVPSLNEFLSRKKSKKDKPPLWRIKDCIKTILRGLNLLDIKDYSYLNIAINNEKFFDAIDYILRDIGEDDGVPLNWYSKFILNNIKKLDDKSYLEDDYKKLFEEILEEERELLEKRKKLSSEINAREGMNIQCSKKIVEKAKYDQKNLEQTKQLQKIETFIAKDQTQICIRVNEKIETEEELKEKKSKEAFNNFKSLVIKSEKESTQYVQIVDANNCEHRSENFMAKIEGKRETDIKTHAKRVNQFITKFSNPNSPVKKLQLLLKYINEDIENGEPTHQLYKAFEDYKNLLKESIKKNDKELIESEDNSAQERELEEILDRIEDHIMFKIYKYVFPINPSPKLKKLDDDFCEKTKLYSWIPAGNFGTKITINRDEIESAINSFKKMEETAQTISEKLNCVKDVYININKAMQFSTGKKDELSADDQLPLLIYIIIQSHPKRFISNIYYMKCFFNVKRQDKVFLDNIISASGTINNIDPVKLDIDPKEFETKVKEAKEKLKLEKE